ncbi:Ethanolamine-phosphate cytidylyltransferase [Thelohanellus kitauei]|uniref:ethanolamine-phosphate cytidylyltransferase n=1 Tax=Thelohanellus kitauei TaxID=669202 RepID=A0A0C2JPV8_THEKT|nr:Ethanolamine-phosphate cytidylyltransferase [Thelohanellus kitauei]
MLENPKNVWVDGCFDLINYGHIILIDLAGSYGENVIVGILSDEEIFKNKRLPILQMQERRAILEAIRGVSQVVCDVPYVTSLEWMDRYNCEWCLHGDDHVLGADGEDPYEHIKKANRFKALQRTGCISTTDIISRILYPEKREHIISKSYKNMIRDKFSSYIHRSPTIANPDQKISYIGGRFDLLHPFLINYFRKIKGQNYLIVGIIGDAEIKKKSPQLPLLCSYERGLAMMACKYVDRVIFDAPLKLTSEFINLHNVRSD